LTGLNYIRSGDEPYNLAPPLLTYRELRYLDSQLPCDADELKAEGLSLEVLRHYAEIYRFYPTYAEAEV
jgi:hypothetical protein